MKALEFNHKTENVKKDDILLKQINMRKIKIRHESDYYDIGQI